MNSDEFHIRQRNDLRYSRTTTCITLSILLYQHYSINNPHKEWTIETGYHGKRDYAYCEDVRTRRCNANIIGAMMLARTPAFVFMAKRGVANSQAFKKELQSDHALPLRMVVDATSN